METQRIVFYEPLAYQMLGIGADIKTYAEFCSAFDSIASTCRARGQSFEKVYPHVPTMKQWLIDNGLKNNDHGRAAFAETLQAVHPPVDYVEKQTFAARNFGSMLGGPVSPFGRGINWSALPHTDPFRT